MTDGEWVAGWLPAPAALSVRAQTFRDLWADRWSRSNPIRLPECLPDGFEIRHVSLDHGFRSPLSFDEECRSEVEYLAEVGRIPAASRPVIALTFEFETTCRGESWHSDYSNLLERRSRTVAE